MLGKTGVVLRDIDPQGKIKYTTEIWNAMAHGKKIVEGEQVVICGFSGMSLVVQAVPGKRE